MNPRVRGGIYGALASVGAVAVVTGAIELLKDHVPVLSLGVLYIFAVLPVAIFWGLALGAAVAIASMLAFNFFFLPPLYTLTIADSRNWFALAVFLVTAVVVSELAARSRREARESALLARIASSLLEHGSVSAELERIADEAAQALRVEQVSIDLAGPSIEMQGRRSGSDAARRKMLPALVSLLRVASDRERLEREAVEAEALRRSDAMKTALLRAVSHDLRTPLMAILTSASALARPDFALDDVERTELLDTVLEEARRLDRLVANLLDLSRLQAGAAVPEFALVSVDDLVVEALEGLGADGLRIDISLPEDPATVRVDPHQVQRALANLLENALKYSPADEPVSVRVASTSTDVLVRVIDRGPGVLQQEAERIFSPFQRGSVQDGTRGAGLGLAIAQGFAEANGGRVWVESHAGQGATFVLALPIAPVEALV